MEIINFKTRFEIGQKVFRVCSDGNIVTDAIKGVVFTKEPFKYVTSCGWHDECELFATFDEALAKAQPKWLEEQKKRCFPEYEYGL